MVCPRKWTYYRPERRRPQRRCVRCKSRAKTSRETKRFHSRTGKILLHRLVEEVYLLNSPVAVAVVRTRSTLRTAQLSLAVPAFSQQGRNVFDQYRTILERTFQQ